MSGAAFWKMPPYVVSKAIKTREELVLIIGLGLSVEVWDIDMNTIRTCHPTSLVRTKGGELIAWQKGGSEYLQWYNIPDPTFRLERHNFYSQYLFNTREDATEALDRYQMNIKECLFQ